MINIKNNKECCGCTACKNICPVNAINMVEDEKEFCYPKVNIDKCIKCEICTKVCPILNYKNDDNILPKAYAAFNKDEQIRMESSSGGIFSLIGQYIISQNGVIYGAAFNKDFLVEHIRIDNIKKLKLLRSSKYIQSNMKDTFKMVKKDLESNKYVLFTGTPCQIEGIKSFLGKDYANFFTQDLICHGVPSKKVWNKYLKETLEKSKNKKLEYICFRNKENMGWNKYQLLFEYENCKEYINHNDDIFMKIFLSDIALRDSCYDCKFKKKHRISDITLADFWGIENVLPEMNDEKGISLVIINSIKGELLLNAIKENLEIKNVNFFDAIKGNPSMILSPLERKNDIKNFFEDLNTETLNTLIDKYIQNKKY